MSSLCEKTPFIHHELVLACGLLPARSVAQKDSPLCSVFLQLLLCTPSVAYNFASRDQSISFFKEANFWSTFSVKIKMDIQ